MRLLPTTAPPFRLGVLVALIVVGVFLLVLGNGWVVTDDESNFLENPHYRGLGPEQVRWALTTVHLGVYQPFAWILLEAQYVVFGLFPAGYHLTSLALHATNAVTFMALAAAILGRCPSMAGLERRRSVQLGAAAAALLFAVHPLRAEVVAWASCQPYLSSALFAMLATLAYLRRDGATRRGRAALLTLSWVLYVAAVLFKAAALALPAAFLILDAFPLLRLSGAGASRRAAVFKALAEKVPFAAAAVFFMVAAYYAKYVADPVVVNEGGGLAGQFARACYAVTFYVAKTAWPTGLTPMYEWHVAARSPDPRLVAGVLGCVALTSGAVWFGRRRPGWLAAWCAYLALLAPTSSLVRSSSVGLVADRYSYIATMPLFVASAYAFARLPVMPRPWIGPATAALAAAVVTLGGLTWRQCLTWRDTEALIVNAVETGAIPRGQYLVYLGEVRERQHRFEEAESCFRGAVRSSPDSAEAANELGGYLARRVNPEAGLPWFERAVALDPRFVQGYNNIGLVLAERGRLEEAERRFEAALRINPYFVNARFNLARTMHDRGRFAEAAENYALVLRGDPGHRRARAALAELFRRAGPVEHRPGTPGRVPRH
jgi:tetratricopeptide (TPR) repeat protein